MTTKLGRHIGVQMTCPICGIKFLQRKSRVKMGIGKYCSKECFDIEQRRRASNNYGFERGKPYFTGGRWTVRWYDESGTVHVTSYPRWWWTVNKGEVPDGYSISYIDGDSLNIDPSNFECIPIGKAQAKGGHKQLGIPKPNMAGENSKWWMGGRNYEYPLAFSKRVKRNIKIRDNSTCQACKCEFDFSMLDVHHKDRDKYNNEESNLITLCKSCHRAVHGKEVKVNAAILELKRLLL